MKIKTMIMALLTGIMAIAISSCSAPEGASDNIDEFNSEERDALVVDIDSTYIMNVRDKLSEYSRYSSFINERFNKNKESLEMMKKNFNAEDSKQRIKFDQEIFDMNKKNVQIKSKAIDAQNHNKSTWDFFKTSTNAEMNELEKSIKALTEREL